AREERNRVAELRDDGPGAGAMQRMQKCAHLVGLEVLVGPEHLGAGTRAPERRDAPLVAMLVAKIILTAREARSVAVSLVVLVREAQRRGVAERNVRDRPPREQIAAAAVDGDLRAPPAELGPARGEQDRAAGVVAPEQRALRAANDLDLVDVEQRVHRSLAV